MANSYVMASTSEALEEILDEFAVSPQSEICIQVCPSTALDPFLCSIMAGQLVNESKYHHFCVRLKRGLPCVYKPTLVGVHTDYATLDGGTDLWMKAWRNQYLNEI